VNASVTETKSQAPSRRWSLWRALAGVSIERRIAALLMALGAASGVATIFAFFQKDWNSRVEADRVTTYLLVTVLAITVALGGIVGHRLALLWFSRRRRQTGAHLHTRLVVLFALIAVIPTVVVSIFSTTFLSHGLDLWFSDRFQDAVGSSAKIVQAYLEEQRTQIKREASGTARAIVDSGALATNDPVVLNEFLNQQASLRGLSEASIITRDRQIIAGGSTSLAMEQGLGLPDSAFAAADAFDIASTANATRTRIRALIALQPSPYYLYIGRTFDEGVRAAAIQNQNAFRLYDQLASVRVKFQITVALIFAVLALFVVMASIWVAIVYATQLVKPISRLATAAEQIGRGDLSARVKIGLAEDDLSALSRTFNVMAIQLQSQQHALIAANRQSDERRRLTELVLSGVSAGVISLADDGTIALPNRSASELLGVNLQNLIGKPLAAISPEMAEIVEKARSRNSGSADGQILFSHGTVNRTFHVRVVSEAEEEGSAKLVVTFDDVSELLSAQRKAAWSDIARRIAHEIKNPLTPIQLSAERLKRKYLRQITEDPDTFTACTDTIVRQVGDIGRMVDEFSAFARMPAPALRPEDARELAKQAAFLQQNAHPSIHYTLDIPPAPIELICDASQFNRAITNLMKNAAESINDRLEEQAARGDTDLTPGEIHLWMKPMVDRLLIGIDDNGRGLPEHNRDRLTEPYVTTRSKGTGLGLAIVKKILEDHGGTLSLSDREGGGASVLMSFPLDAAALNVADSGKAHAAAGSA
jgi:two-component system nitrogen regulation sensor histidine kinase NtrY